MKELGNTIYLWGCVVAATILGVGVADFWFGHSRFTAFLSWAALAGHSVDNRPRIAVLSEPHQVAR